jgi:hypothetical protein
LLKRRLPKAEIPATGCSRHACLWDKIKNQM